jgi:deoxyribodipyrimidine photo-lyase
MTTTDPSSPILVWIRRDLRLSDNPALQAAHATGRPVIPVFILDPVMADMGAAAEWRMGQGLSVFARTLAQAGSQLILRTGAADTALDDLIATTGAGAVFWNRAYDPAAMARDTAIKETLKSRDLDARSFAGNVLFEPWTVQTKTGGFYKVYSPFWRAIKDRDVAHVPTVTGPIAGPTTWPETSQLGDLNLGAGMNRGAAVLAEHTAAGEQAALDALSHFLDENVDRYSEYRDFPALRVTSGLSEYLATGEIGARTCWHAGMRARHDGRKGAEKFVKEVVWRDFAYHLLFHTPHILTTNWRDGWDSFGWNRDATRADVIAWKQGRTGVAFVDAAMREMYVTGKMHNRARMIVGSYLTKHLLTDWKIGRDWFAECLTDWDIASNAMGWQWIAGCGPDAAPYFRVFNPETQLEKFDKPGAYSARWIAEGTSDPSATALRYFDAIPRRWDIAPTDPYPRPAISLSDGRIRALEAYAANKT